MRHNVVLLTTGKSKGGVQGWLAVDRYCIHGSGEELIILKRKEVAVRAMIFKWRS
jgi:hypothetical protein